MIVLTMQRFSFGLDGLLALILTGIPLNRLMTNLSGLSSFLKITRLSTLSTFIVSLDVDQLLHLRQSRGPGYSSQTAHLQLSLMSDVAELTNWRDS